MLNWHQLSSLCPLTCLPVSSKGLPGPLQETSMSCWWCGVQLCAHSPWPCALWAVPRNPCIGIHATAGGWDQALCMCAFSCSPCMRCSTPTKAPAGPTVGCEQALCTCVPPHPLCALGCLGNPCSVPSRCLWWPGLSPPLAPHCSGELLAHRFLYLPS